MIISDDVLGCLGAVLLLILAILCDGLIFWGIGNLIIWMFNINISFYFWQGILIGLLWKFLTHIFKKGW